MHPGTFLQNLMQPLVGEIFVLTLVGFHELGISLDSGEGSFQFMGHIIIEFLAAAHKPDNLIFVRLHFFELGTDGFQHYAEVPGQFAYLVTASGICELGQHLHIYLFPGQITHNLAGNFGQLPYRYQEPVDKKCQQ